MDILENLQKTDAADYVFYDCKNKYESNATLQLSTEHKTNKEKPCQSVVFGVFRLLLFWGKKAVFVLPRLQDE